MQVQDFVTEFEEFYGQTELTDLNKPATYQYIEEDLYFENLALSGSFHKDKRSLSLDPQTIFKYS